MTAQSVTTVVRFDCEVRKCAATFTPAAPEVATDARWHAPADPGYYTAGWVTKIGHSQALHYCEVHRRRAFRCTCEHGYVRASCAAHSDIADVRVRPNATRARATALFAHNAPPPRMYGV